MFLQPERRTAFARQPHDTVEAFSPGYYTRNLDWAYETKASPVFQAPGRPPSEARPRGRGRGFVLPRESRDAIYRALEGDPAQRSSIVRPTVASRYKRKVRPTGLRYFNESVSLRAEAGAAQGDAATGQVRPAARGTPRLGAGRREGSRVGISRQCSIAQTTVVFLFS